jgi:hypothetical protein
MLGIESEDEDFVGLLTNLGRFGGSGPLRVDNVEIIIGRPTGDCARLSDVDRDVVVPCLGE